jgi:Fic family protein
MTTEVMTYKSGKFKFSAKYDKDQLNLLRVQTQILYQTVRDLPILPNLASQIQEELIKKSIFSTAAIEGNPLSEEDVSGIIDDNVSGKERAEKEISNLKQAYLYLRGMNPTGGKLNLSEKIVKDLHSSITNEIEYPDNVPGKYRSHRVQVGDKTHGGVYTPPKVYEDIVMLMPKYVEWMNSDEVMSLDPFYRASLAHYHLSLIHPFGDGNGRTARLLEALILQSAGIKYVPMMLSNFYYQKMDDYYKTFAKTQRDNDADITEFLRFSLVGAVESLEEIKSRITYHIRIMALRDYVHFQRNEKNLTRRQSDLMAMLVDNPNLTFTLKELNDKTPYTVLYRDVSPITARRDVKRLLDMQLIELEDNRYVLNLRALDG